MNMIEFNNMLRAIDAGRRVTADTQLFYSCAVADLTLPDIFELVDLTAFCELMAKVECALPPYFVGKEPPCTE